MAIERHHHEDTSWGRYEAVGTRQPVMDTDSGGFDCNICLDTVRDPVVTLCGHLYCWPCIYKWLYFQTQNETQPHQPECPVCKARVSHTTLVPLYGRGQTAKSNKDRALPRGLAIPQRPLGPGCGQQLDHTRSRQVQPVHHHNRSQSYTVEPTLHRFGMTTTNVFDPVIGMIAEMIHTRLFGRPIGNMYNNSNSFLDLAGNTTSVRVRRHIMQADKSLSRISFFLLCCVLLCLLLF